MFLAPSASTPLGHWSVLSAIHTNAAMACRKDLTVNFQGTSWKGPKTWDPLMSWSQLDFFLHKKLQFHINNAFPQHRSNSHSKTKRSRTGSTRPQQRLGCFSENWETGILRTRCSGDVSKTEWKAFCSGAKEHQIPAHHAAFMSPFIWLILLPKRFLEHQVPVNTDNWRQLILNFTPCP